ncbi:MAG: prepilin-type N-terminal cleavage/methylation domain-containing protein [Minisyncoccota bacterium]
MNVKKNGFTLIELLVVISIISLLASIVLAGLNSARIKGRDAQRLSDLHQLQNALALYYAKNNAYPDTSNKCAGDECSSAQASWNTTTNPLYALVTQGFIPKLPIDPTNTPIDNVLQNGGQYAGKDYSYYYSTSGTNQKYDLLTRLENPGNPNSCGVKGQTYCASVVWSGWNWKTDTTNGDYLVYYHP